MAEHPLILEAATVAKVLRLDPVVHLSGTPLERAVRVATVKVIQDQQAAEAEQMKKNTRRG